MDWNGIDRIWLLTWTTYGTWLPGDDRGFVSPKFEGPVPERRNNEPGQPYDEGRPALRLIADSKRAGDPVRLSRSQARLVRRQIEETARHRGWQLLAGAIMANHIHLVVGVPGDPDPSALLRDFKSYASRALNIRHPVAVKPRWWTEHGSKRKIADWDNLKTVIRYVRDQCLPWKCGMIWRTASVSPRCRIRPLARETETAGSRPPLARRPRRRQRADAPRSPGI